MQQRLQPTLEVSTRPRYRRLFRIGLSAMAAAALTGALVRPYLHPATAESSSTCGANLQRVGVALTSYATEHKGHYPTSVNELVPRYLDSVPVCPGRHQPYLASFGRWAPNNPGYDNFVLLECRAHGMSEAFASPSETLPESAR